MIAKLLLTVAVIAVVWLGVRYVGRWLGGAGAAPGVGNAAPGGAIGDLTRCAVCETYVEAAAAAACERADCPRAGTATPP